MGDAVDDDRLGAKEEVDEQRSEALRWTEPLYSLEVSSRPEKDQRGGRVIVFGTSYSARLKDSEWSIGALLAKALNRDIVDLSYHAAGPVGGFVKFKSMGYKLRRGDLVIW